MCWGVGGGKERYVGSEVWGGCGKVYGVSGEVCWRVGKGCGEGNGEDVGKCVEVWGPNTLLIPHISLPSPFPPSPLTSPTPHHTFLHLLWYLFPHLFFLPPHPNTFSYYPHISLHLLKVWRSYHETKFLWRSYCGEVTMWRSYWQPIQGGGMWGMHPPHQPFSTMLCMKKFFSWFRTYS